MDRAAEGASGAEGAPHMEPPPARRRSIDYAADVQIHVKDLLSREVSVNVNERHTMRDLKQQIHSRLSSRYPREPQAAIPPDEQILIYRGRVLADETLIRDANLQKDCTLTVRRKGKATRSVATVEPSDEVDEPRADAAQPMDSEGSSYGVTSSTAAAAASPRLRIFASDGSSEYDGSDGWAVAEGLKVADAQKWYRNSFQHQFNGWREWGDHSSGIYLNYLINRTTNPYCEEMATFLTEHMGKTALGDASKWSPMPSVLHDLDRQLRAVLVHPEFNVSLLGEESDGTFILGYVQPTRMPTAMKGNRLTGATTQSNGRRLTQHKDKAACTWAERFKPIYPTPLEFPALPLSACAVVRSDVCPSRPAQTVT